MCSSIIFNFFEIDFYLILFINFKTIIDKDTNKALHKEIIVKLPCIYIFIFVFIFLIFQMTY